jgi:long-chain acyl-CoA synthetase
MDPQRIAERTLVGIFARRAAEAPAGLAVRYHDGQGWKAMTWGEMRDQVLRVAARLLDEGVEPGDRVAILSPNRVEWQVCDLAIQVAGAVTVPVYPNVPARQAAQILDHSGARLVFVGGERDAARVAPRRSVRMDTELAGWIAAAPREETTARVELRSEFVRPEDLSTIVYTSGTTGDPKGVMLTHRCIADMVRAGLETFPLGPDDSELSFLPYAHVFERINGTFTRIGCGASAWLSRGTDRLAEDLRECQPTIVVSVPRVYEKMHQQVMAQVAQSPPQRRLIFRWALEQGRRRSRGEPARLHAVAERLVLARLREALTGGRLRFFLSGGAPLSRSVEEFFWSIGVKILNGWGMTETSSGACSNTLTAHRFETAGRPLPGVEMSLADDGELLVRSPGNMLGYYRDEAATAQVLRDGWLHTGDVAEIDPGGFVRITDRKKDLIKTSGGKYVAPQVHETRLQQADVIERAVVVGEQRPYVVALIAPDWDAVRRQGIGGQPSALLDDERVRSLVGRPIDELNRDLGSWETIKYFALVEDFSEGRGEITPTLKVKRRVVEANQRDRIEAMYAQRRPPAEAHR